MTDPWTNVPALVDSLPEASLLQRALIDRITSAYAVLREQRGDVHTPEDTFDMQRRLASTEERFREYGRAFGSAAKVLASLREEELIEARGEQDHIPLDGLTVPDKDGDIRISLDAPAVYDIDTQQLLAVLFVRISDMIGRLRRSGVDEEEIRAQSFEAAMSTLFALGKFEPQVSKVKAWAASLARDGCDKDSAVVTSAITKRNPYKGVKFERTKPK